VKKYGPWKGMWRAAKRVGRCHPFHPGGYDPA
jgi:putative component of membrane protein insertase Oxa1/YidC/SpoIIIJ protein YidD